MITLSIYIPGIGYRPTRCNMSGASAWLIITFISAYTGARS